MTRQTWIVSPFHGRFDISELVLEQWRWLRDSGYIAGVVIAACDENLELALERDFVTVEVPNDRMGVRWNTAFRCAASLGADRFCYVGSDNWVHPSVFHLHPFQMPTSGRKIDFVDVSRGVLQHAELHDQYGAIPWTIPRSLLESCDFEPMPARMQIGAETMLAHGMGRPDFVHRVEEFAPCVDFKSEESLSPYAGVRNSIGDGVEHDAVQALAFHWPSHLVERAGEVIRGRVCNA